jgi:RNA polymerase sigma-70 factor (ECF subfamily)
VSTPSPAPPFGSSPDAQLAGRVARGDADAERELVDRFRPGLVTLLRFRTRDPEAAQELAHDVLMSVLGALRADKVREVDRLAAFVHGTARNLLNNHFRRQSGRPRTEPIEDHEQKLAARDEAPARERQAVVRRALAELEPLDRQVLSFVMNEGLAAAEIGARVGLSPEAVRMRKSRALKKVSERVREWLRM